MNVPKIRINGFEGEWKRIKLAECLNISNETNKDNVYGKDDVLSVSDEIGVVNQIKHLGRSYAGKSVTNYGILKKGQIVYTKSPLKAKPFGVVKQNLGDAGIVSVLYAIYDAKEGVDAGYIHYYFDPAWRLNAYIRPLVNKGAKNTMNISDETALEGYIYLPPTLAEQQQIVEYFGQLDSLIEATGKKITSLKQTKQACLQQMFPAEGETTPRVRFKGFEGDWAILPLSTFAQKSKEKNMSREYTAVLTNSAEYGVINQKDFFDHDIAKDNHIDRYSVIHNDDFVYNPRVSVSAPVGPINRNMLGYSGVMSPLYLIFKVENIDKEYLSYFFKTKLWHPYMKIEGNTGARFDRLALSDTQFFGLPIYAPKEEAEQQQIAAFFSNMDKQIRIQEQRLEKLKQIKAACLENMFV